MLDSCDRAYAAFKDIDDAAKLKESFEVLYRQVQDCITKLDVTKVKTAGELFDPNYHEAVMREETDEHPDNLILTELQCGYMLKEKVLRPAMVKVASNSSQTPAQEASATENN